MNFLITSLCLSAMISYVLAPPPRYVVVSLSAVAILIGILLYTGGNI